jgi:hypothetical protein
MRFVARQHAGLRWGPTRFCAGVKPSDLPVQQPTRFDLIVDLATGWKIWSNEDLITLGIAWRGQFVVGFSGVVRGKKRCPPCYSQRRTFSL